MEHSLLPPPALLVLQAVAVVAVARGIGVLTRRIGQPMVIAEVVAGIVLGPSLLGWLFPHVSGWLFPASSMPLLSGVSEIGLILFMFLVGLELDPQLLKKRVHASVAISHSSIIVPFALGALFALRVYPTLAPPGVPFASFVLFMGVAMSITAFPVLARILVERRLLRTRVGAVTIACAAVDDVTAWCILAFVVSVARASNIHAALITTVIAVSYVLAMLFLVRPLLERITARTKLGLSQNVVAVILLGVFLSSLATQLIGIHALFGAFLFGAIMPKQGSFATALAEKLEDLVVVVLLPLFFAYSGLRTQIGLLSTPDTWVTCLVITLIASAGKFGGSAAAARIMGLSWRESAGIGVLMNTRGLMELVALNIGLDLGVISPALFTMMVIMALVTTFVTTPALQRIYPAEELARELADAVGEAPASLPMPVRRFTALVCVAYERSGPGLVSLAAALTGKDPEKSRVYALRLVRATMRPSFVLDQREAAESEGAQAPQGESGLVPLLEHAEASGVPVRPISFVTADPARDICDVAAVKHADVVLLGWHKPILGTTMLSGTVHEVMRSARSTVGVLVDRNLGPIRRVLVPYLGREHDRAALRIARRIAGNVGAQVTVLHVLRSGAAPSPSFTSELEATPPGVPPADLAVATRADQTPVEAVISESARGYDLVVVGIGSEWGLEHRSFGLRTESILRRSPVSVLVVRGAEDLATAPAAAAVAQAVGETARDVAATS